MPSLVSPQISGLIGLTCQVSQFHIAAPGAILGEKKKHKLVLWSPLTSHLIHLKNFENVYAGASPRLIRTAGYSAGHCTFQQASQMFHPIRNSEPLAWFGRLFSIADTCSLQAKLFILTAPSHSWHLKIVLIEHMWS